MRKIFLYILTFFIAAMIISCKPAVPNEIIQPSEMEDILYDYHVAGEMASLDNRNADYNSRLYKLAVLKKYGVSEADFDSSLVYYTRHADRLHELYGRLAERMGKEAVALGADVGEVNKYNVAEGDTANIWRENKNLSLIPAEPYNVVSFAIPADTSYHKGDRFVMMFDAQFLYQDGMKDGIAQLVVKFSNDSVASRLMHMSSNMRYTLEVNNGDSLGIKEVRGFIYLSKDPNDSESTLKLMILKNIRLIRFHAEKNKKPQKTSFPDSQPITNELDTSRKMDLMKGDLPVSPTR